MSLITNKPILVTGGTGFVASHTIQQLLLKGYKVRATVRDLGNKEKYEFLQRLDGATERLELVQADLMSPSSLEPCFQDVEYVLHIASPFMLTASDPKRDLLDPAVNGTIGVLELCKKNTNIKRVVLTSSMASVSDSFDSSKTYNEDDWNEASSLTRNPYYYSKTQAEKSAVEFMTTNKDLHFDLVRILPFVVLGPSLNATLNESHNFIANILRGKLPGIVDLSFGFCDVRDIATAHIIAMENPTANGRYCCSLESHHMREVVQIIRDNFPSFTRVLPKLEIPNWIARPAAYGEEKGMKDVLLHSLGRIPHIDNSKAIALGIPFRPWNETLIDTVQFMIDNKIVKIPENKQTSSTCIIS